MAEAGKRKETEMKETQITSLSEDNMIEIFIRLPAKSVLRAGAVCKVWRRITAEPAFLAAHARFRPADVVLYTYQFSPQCKYRRRGPYFEDELALDLLPTSSDSDDDDDDDNDDDDDEDYDDEEEEVRRRLIRYPKNGSFFLLASCNGVLLFQRSLVSFLLCNPTTRKWARLPGLTPRARPGLTNITRGYGFYYDEPSGEYRLLVCRRGKWLILSTAADDPRQIDLPAELADTMGITTLLVTTPVALERRLHWPPRQAAGAPAAAAAAAATAGAGGSGSGSQTGTSTSKTEMSVFDTVSETFHLMAGPPTATAELTKVFEMKGQLVAADFGDERHVDLWFLEDYDAGRWERRHRAPAPWHAVTPSLSPWERWRHPSCVAAVGDERNDTVTLGNHSGLAVYSLRTRTSRAVDVLATSRNRVTVSQHAFRESLEQHPSFAARSAAELGVATFWN